MTAGYYSPMPPEHSGVADYSVSLIAAMSEFGEVRVNQPGDVNLYHLGNNRLHLDAYHASIATPGVSVIHDAVLHHFMLGTLSRDEYIAEFEFNYGAWNRDLAARLWTNRARSGIDPEYFRYPMLKRAVEAARTVVTHNPSAARIAAEHGARRVVEIPHLFSPPPLPPEYEIIRLRDRLLQGRRKCLFGVFGHLRESKRLTSVLRAFDNVVSSGSEAVLLVAGDFVSPDLARSMKPLLQQKGVLWTGYLSDEDFWRYALAIDVCVNLRYPQAGETSGIGIRMMGLGKPVIVTASEETASFPETTCLRVDGGTAEIEMLTAYMQWLSASPREAAEIGARAARHIADFHNPTAVARQFWDVLQ